MAALTAIRCNEVIAEYAERLREAGKVFTVVITACTRRLLVFLNAMVRNKTPWTPTGAPAMT